VLLRRAFGLSAHDIYQVLPDWEVELLLAVAEREQEQLTEEDGDGTSGDDLDEPSAPPQIPKSRR
jgi:hypothetical protein